MRKFTKHVFSVLASGLLLLAPANLSAVPAYPGKMKVRQADGSVLTIQLVGDEYGHLTTTADGYPLVFNLSTRNYEYALEDANGLKASGMAATEEDRRTADARKLLASVDKQKVMKTFATQWTQARAEAADARKATLQAKAPARVVRINDVPTKGKHDVLVILVQFADAKFTDNNVMTDPVDYYDRFFHEEGFSEHGGRGSAYDYYRFASKNQYDPQFKVYGPVTVSGKASDYAGSNGSALTYKMIQEAVPLVNSQFDVDFSTFDTDGDGSADNVYCIYAGYGQADSGNTSTIWPHSGNLDLGTGRDRSFLVDGVKIDRYTVSQEVNGQTNVPVGIGTFVHEFGHVLGLADHYNNGATASMGYTNNVGNWDVMASGSYNDDQNCPPTFSAFERYSLGWETPVELTATADSLVTLSPYTEEGQCYRVSVPNEEGEYFLIENRQQKSWDSYLPGHGVLVWHIDEDQSVWDKNQPNADASHQHVDIVEAGRTLSSTGMPTDPFPGARDVRSFNFSDWNSRSTFGFDWVDEAADGHASFILSNSAYRLPSPEVAVDSLMGTSARVVWGETPLAKTYDVMIYQGGTMVDSVKATAPGSTLFHGLEPETPYSARVVATLSTVTSDTASVEFTTLPRQMEEWKPEVLAATNVTATSFTAHWKAVPEADGYDVALFTRTHDGHGKMGTGFDDFTTSVPNLPEGWSLTAKQGRNDKTFGEAAPAIRLRADSANLVVALKGNSIDSLSFWHFESTDGLILNVDKYADGAWSNLWQFASDEKAWRTEQVYVGGADSLRIVLTRTEGKTGGYVLLDDVYLSYLFDQFTWEQTFATTAAGSDAFHVAADGTTLSYTVTGLRPDEVYGYSVQAHLGDRLSLMSDTLGVDTTGVLNGIHVVDVASQPMAVYDLQGRRVATLTAGVNAAAMLPKGIYVVRGKKIVIK